MTHNELSVKTGLEEAFDLLFSSNPIPMWIVDVATLEFLAVNESAVDLYGYSKEEFLGMKLTDIRPTEDNPRLVSHIQAAASDGYQGEWRHALKNGRLVDIEVNCHSIHIGGRLALLFASRDITKRKTTERALKESEERYRIVSELTSEYMASIGINEDGSLRFQWFTESIARDYGWALEEINALGGPAAVVEENDLAYAMEVFNKVIRGEQASGDIRTRGKDGRTRWVSFYVQPLADPVTGEIKRIICAGRSITTERDSQRRLKLTVERLKKVGDERQHLVQRLLEIQEDERRRVASDLHDELGQVLTSASLFVKSMMSAPQDAMPDLMSALGNLLEEAVGSVRRITWNLRAPELEEAGLMRALELLVEQTGALTSIQFEIATVGADRRLSPEMETAVYRVVQEAITNIIRHSAAAAASVVLMWSESNLDVLVEDDGKGFTLDSIVDGQPSLGLSGMRERALSIGAELVVESTPSVGTMIRLRVPEA